MNLQEKTRNFFQNYAFFGRKSRFRGTKYRFSLQNQSIAQNLFRY